MSSDESFEFLKKTYPAKLSQAKARRDEYFAKVMGAVKTYFQKKPSLVFQRSQEDLYILGFPKEACVVSRTVLEDALKQSFPELTRSTLDEMINSKLRGKSKKLAHLIRKNGNVFAHEPWTEDEPILAYKSIDEKALESAKALNQVLVALGYKEPELR